MAVVGALATGVVSILATPINVVDTITMADQTYLSYYGFNRTHIKGHTGEGVTIMMIDGKVNTFVPKLASVNITVKTSCTINSLPALETHGAGVMSILVSTDYGMAPKVSFLAYQGTSDANGGQGNSDCDDPSGVIKDGQPWLLNQAMNDGAQVTNVSVSTPNEYKELKWATARAIAQQVILANTVGDSSRNDDAISSSAWSGMVGVTAISIDGTRQDYSSWGQDVVTTLIGEPVLFCNVEIGANDTIFGTSVVSPIVAGILVLAEQRWPEATNNQLLQLLVKTGLNPDYGWNEHMGFGGIDPDATLNMDPSQFPDENLLAQKQDGSSPTPEEVQQYTDDVVDSTDIVNDSSYTCRGFDKSKPKDGLNVCPTHLGASLRYYRK